MPKINIYDLLSEAIEDGLGNTSAQKQNVSALFIDGLFSDEFGEMEFAALDGENGIEYFAKFDGHKGVGKTPALALQNLLQEVVDRLYYAKNGRP